jgi:hypothetical protein
LNPGWNTFTAQYRFDPSGYGGTSASFGFRRITVFPY